jgi:chaperone required for assembly of F1-ATPase
MRRPLAVPGRALAVAVADEWARQEGTVRPPAMPLTRLATTAIDVVGTRRAAMVENVAGYAASDLVCYRAEGPAELVRRQAEAWQPLVDWVGARFDARLAITRGVVPVAQPGATLAVLRRAVEARDDWRLAALASVTAAAGSVVIGLAVLEGVLGPEAAFRASQVDESFEIEHWGEDPEATARREELRATIAAAARFLALLGDQTSSGR